MANRIVPLFLLIFVLSGFLAIRIGYPLANAGNLDGLGSDADEALMLASERLLVGSDPYSERTYLGNPISPLPGSILIYAALGILFDNAAVINFVTLVIGLVLAWQRFPTSVAMFAMGLIVSPIFWHSIVTGNDFITTAGSAALIALRLIDAALKSLRFALLWTVPLGALIASRSLMLLVVLGVTLTLCTLRSCLRGVIVGIGTVAVASALALPFLLGLSDEFAPFHTNSRLGGLAGLLAAAAVAACWLAFVWFRIMQRDSHLLDDGQDGVAQRFATWIAPLAPMVSVYPALHFATWQFLGYGAATAILIPLAIFWSPHGRIAKDH